VGGAVREGTALLQGRIRCGKCGRMMQTGYSGAKGQPGGQPRVDHVQFGFAHRALKAEHQPVVEVGFYYDYSVFRSSTAATCCSPMVGRWTGCSTRWPTGPVPSWDVPALRTLFGAKQTPGLPNSTLD
jgi:hypothetical protein